MKVRLLIVSFFITSTFAITTSAFADIPKELISQVQSVTDLLSDGDAVGYPEATMVQQIKNGKFDEVDLVVFSIEGFGGGNNYQQFFAVFLKKTAQNGNQHYKLVDVIHIGGGGWRAIQKLDAKTTSNLIDVAYLGEDHWGDEVIAGLKDQNIITNIKSGSTITIDAMENRGIDSPNFPSKKTTITLLLKGGRLYEQEAQ